MNMFVSRSLKQKQVSSELLLLLLLVHAPASM
jgi:hypothetical protein